MKSGGIPHPAGNTYTHRGIRFRSTTSHETHRYVHTSEGPSILPFTMRQVFPFVIQINDRRHPSILQLFRNLFCALQYAQKVAPRDSSQLVFRPSTPYKLRNLAGITLESSFIEVVSPRCPPKLDTLRHLPDRQAYRLSRRNRFQYQHCKGNVRCLSSGDIMIRLTVASRPPEQYDRHDPQQSQRSPSRDRQQRTVKS